METELKTIVIQSFRRENVPVWILRCLQSAQDWAQLRGYDYAFFGDEFFEHCGENYISRTGGHICLITDLARLAETKRKLEEGYGRVVWIDADMLVFDPENFDVSKVNDYSFGFETWVDINQNGEPVVTWQGLHNAFSVFTHNQTDLDLFIHIMRHLVEKRPQLPHKLTNVKMIAHLAPTLNIKPFTACGMLSVELVRAILDGRADYIAQAIRFHGSPLVAANLCFSLLQGNDAAMAHIIDLLLGTRGRIVNQTFLVESQAS